MQLASRVLKYILCFVQQSPSESLTTDSGSMIDDVDNTEAETETTDTLPPVCSLTNISEPPTPVNIKLEASPSAPESGIII